MNLATVLLYPIALLLPAAAAIDGRPVTDEVPEVQASQGVDRLGGDSLHYAWPTVPPLSATDGARVTITAFPRVDLEPAWQVRIQQRMTIRITPRAASPRQPDMRVAMPDVDNASRFAERKMGRCLPVSGIAGVQPQRDNRLLLYMRDRRLVSAELERACRAMDFYSGFYLSPNSDGLLCVERDSLLTRSGMNCKLTRIRQLVDTGG